MVPAEIILSTALTIKNVLFPLQFFVPLVVALLQDLIAQSWKSVVPIKCYAQTSVARTRLTNVTDKMVALLVEFYVMMALASSAILCADLHHVQLICHINVQMDSV
jgi:hypothetical protein